MFCPSIASGRLEVELDFLLVKTLCLTETSVLALDFVAVLLDCGLESELEDEATEVSGS